MITCEQEAIQSTYALLPARRENSNRILLTEQPITWFMKNIILYACTVNFTKTRGMSRAIHECILSTYIRYIYLKQFSRSVWSQIKHERGTRRALVYRYWCRNGCPVPLPFLYIFSFFVVLHIIKWGLNIRFVVTRPSLAEKFPTLIAKQSLQRMAI